MLFNMEGLWFSGIIDEINGNMEITSYVLAIENVLWPGFSI